MVKSLITRKTPRNIDSSLTKGPYNMVRCEDRLHLQSFKNKWKKRNSHNTTKRVSIALRERQR